MDGMTFDHGPHKHAQARIHTDINTYTPNVTRRNTTLPERIQKRGILIVDYHRVARTRLKSMDHISSTAFCLLAAACVARGLH